MQICILQFTKMIYEPAHKGANNQRKEALALKVLLTYGFVFADCGVSKTPEEMESIKIVIDIPSQPGAAGAGGTRIHNHWG